MNKRIGSAKNVRHRRLVATWVALMLAGCSCSETATSEPVALTAEPEAEVAADAAALCTAFLAGRDPSLADLGLEGGCMPSGRGAWQLETEVTATTCEEDWSFGRWEGRMRIRYATLTGVSTALPWISLPGCEASVEVDVLGHRDWDADGYSELVVGVTEAGPEDGSVRYAFWRFDGTTLTPYAPAAPFVAGLSNAADFDGDGRLDWISHLPLGRPVTSWSADGGDLLNGDVLTLWHALPDGTFSRSDEVAVPYLRDQCPPSASYFSSDDLDIIRQGAAGIHTAIPVVCARLRGVTTSEIRAALEREVADIPCEDPQPCFRDGVIDELITLAERTDLAVRLE